MGILYKHGRVNNKLKGDHIKTHNKLEEFSIEALNKL